MDSFAWLRGRWWRGEGHRSGGPISLSCFMWHWLQGRGVVHRQRNLCERHCPPTQGYRPVPTVSRRQASLSLGRVCVRVCPAGPPREGFPSVRTREPFLTQQELGALRTYREQAASPCLLTPASRPSEHLLARRGHSSHVLSVAVSWQRPQVTSYRVMVVPDF